MNSEEIEEWGEVRWKLESQVVDQMDGQVWDQVGDWVWREVWDQIGWQVWEQSWKNSDQWSLKWPK